MSYLKDHGTRRTPQSEALPGQVENSAGGFVYAIAPLERLRRFLILGSEGGSYYANERQLTAENVLKLADVIRSEGVAAVELIADVSERGVAPKNDPAVFALAYAIAEGDDETKRAALDALPRVCRIPTHLFMLVEFLDKSFGKATGRAKRRAFAKWLVEREVGQLAYHAVKYRNREGWSFRDLLRLAHPARTVSSGNPTVPVTPEQAALFDWMAHGKPAELPPIIHGFLEAQSAPDAQRTAQLVRQYRLPREALQTDHLNEAVVWEALLESDMPLTAMIRNLATMTRAGVISPGSYGANVVIDRLADGERLRRSRVHPLNVLMAMRTYQSGRGLRGTNTWRPVVQVVDALEDAFYRSFTNVEPSDKRHLIALDISGSMDSGMVGGVPLTPREAAGAMAMVTAAAARDNYEAVTFSCAGVNDGWYSPRRSRWAGHGLRDGIEPFMLSPRQRLTDVVQNMHALPMGGTDCALPMEYAIAEKREVDVFVIYTDNETWAGDVHPMQALAEYRRQSGIEARLVVVGLTATDFTIADPADPGTLDVVGFDSSAPALIGDFAAGRI